MPTVGSLFSGAGLLDCGLSLAGFEHAWLCESVPERRELLRARFPGVPVYDDVRTVRGPFAADAFGYALREQSEPVAGSGGAPLAGRAREAASDANGSRADAYAEASGSRCAVRQRDFRACGVDLVAGGFPCKGASTAGKRNGFDHAETVLWHEMRRVIREVRPRYVLIENVANILGMAAGSMEPPGSLWGSVVGDLAALGFGDIRWDCVPAAAVGAPHLRDRVFAVARHTASGGWDAAPDSTCGERGQRRRAGTPGGSGSDVEPAPNPDEAGWLERGGSVAGKPQLAAAERARADAPDSGGERRNGRPRESREGRDAPKWGEAGRDIGDGHPASAGGVAVDWGDYRPAIQRWEAIHGPAPEALVRRLDDGGATVQRMRARLDRQRLSALGDGVHVTVAHLVGLAVMRHIQTGQWA